MSYDQQIRVTTALYNGFLDRIMRKYNDFYIFGRIIKA